MYQLRDVRWLFSSASKKEARRERGEINAFVEERLRTDSEFSAFHTMLLSGRMEDPETGRSEPLTNTGLDVGSVGVLHYLAHSVGASRTIETGFGLGTSAAAILLAGRGLPDQVHVSIDPSGTKDRGFVLESYLSRMFPSQFRKIQKRSEIILPAMIANGDGPFDLAFIDGNHHFDGTLVDFFFLDQLCRVGGLIIMDDVEYPAIETVVSFVRANYSTYQVRRIGRFAVLTKTGADVRKWDHFRPFPVPQRTDWTRRK